MLLPGFLLIDKTNVSNILQKNYFLVNRKQPLIAKKIPGMSHHDAFEKKGASKTRGFRGQ
jgi:hypothetical protein